MSPDEYAQLVAFLGERFAEIDRRFAQMDQRFDQMDQRFDALRAEMLGHFDEVYRRLERLEQEYHAITQGLRRIEVLLADEKTRREILERSLEVLKSQVAALQARIEDVERRLGAP